MVQGIKSEGEVARNKCLLDSAISTYCGYTTVAAAASAAGISGIPLVAWG